MGNKVERAGEGLFRGQESKRNEEGYIQMDLWRWDASSGYRASFIMEARKQVVPFFHA